MFFCLIIRNVKASRIPFWAKNELKFSRTNHESYGKTLDKWLDMEETGVVWAIISDGSCNELIRSKSRAITFVINA